MNAWIGLTVITVALVASTIVPDVGGQNVAHLEPVRQSEQCGPTLQNCLNLDAVVFVPGIYGSVDTFTNATTGFDWPAEFPSRVGDRQVDVFRLTYRTALLSWAAQANPDLKEVAKAVFAELAPLRKRQYRSIGFIAHSLGGNVVSTYIHEVKTALGHPQRSQNAYVITLATPVLGAQIADLASDLKSLLLMSDPLLDSLKNNNVYLEMLEEFREEEVGKETRYVCRPVHLHAAYEEKWIGPLLVVGPHSAAESIANLVTSPVVGFPLNHLEIARPKGNSDPVYHWVMDRVGDEFRRLATWDYAHTTSPASRKLCELTDFVPES